MCIHVETVAEEVVCELVAELVEEQQVSPEQQDPAQCPVDPSAR